MSTTSKVAVLFVASTFVAICHAVEIEFEGFPEKVVYVEDGTATEKRLSEKQAKEAKVQIVKTESGYVWATRKNLPLERSESGVYITYTARSGAGYVRVINPSMRSMLKSLPPAQQEKEFVYAEHLVNRLGSVTYFGK